MSPALKIWSNPLFRHTRIAGKYILDIFFPLSCLGCAQNDTLLCRTCCTKIKPRYEQSCPYCRRHVTPHGETCFACSPKNALDGVFVAYEYSQHLVNTSLHAFKYHSLESLAHPLSGLFTRAIISSGLPLPDCVLPVPLHPWKQRFRGFNQSELLGRSLARTLLPGVVIPFDASSLVRHRFTLPQQKMPDIESRKHNIKNAFSFIRHDTSSVQGKFVWIIDDITTTSSTLDACARVLKQAGARKVFGVVFAQNTFIPHTKRIRKFSSQIEKHPSS